MGRRLLFVFRNGPHGSASAREGLEAALAALAFEHRVDALFLGEGVLVLKAGQDTVHAGVKDFAPGFGALLHHGLERAVVSASGMQALGLEKAALTMPVDLLPDAALADWIAEHDAVLSF